MSQDSVQAGGHANAGHFGLDDRRPDDDPEFLPALRRYLNGGSRETAEALERFGVKVIGMRHHSGVFVLDGEPDGFPVAYLTRALTTKDSPHG